MSSPALSNVTRFTTDTTETTSSSTSTSTSHFNYAELFDDVVWKEVNLIDIEREWRNELNKIEKVLHLNLYNYHLISISIRTMFKL